MNHINRSPAFNMKVVVQETGIKPDTLRAWERRYGLPDPQRTAGGHRLYSQYDIDLLKWLLARLDEGMSISHAVTMWRQLEVDGKDPLLASGPTSSPEPALAGKKISGDMIADARQGWIQACLGFQEAEAQRILAQAFALFPVELVCIELLQKGMAELGEGWYQGKVTVQQEHFASAIAVRQLEALLASMPAATRHGCIVTACSPGEQHTFGLLLLTLMLRRQGWDVVYLGANVPLEQLQETLERIEPNLVVLTAQTLPAAGSMLPVADMVHNARILFAFGGVVFSQIPDLYQRIPGYFLGVDLQQAPQQIEKLFNTTVPPRQALRADSAHQTALAHFREKRAAIETTTQQQLGNNSLRMDRITMINQELSRNVVAALTLGDLQLLNANIDWVEGMLNYLEYPLSHDLLRLYLQTYAAATEKHLHEKHGAIIVNWFSALMDTV